MPIRLRGSYDKDPSPFHLWVEEQNYREAHPELFSPRLEPCVACGKERYMEGRIQLQMSEVQAIFMSQEIEEGHCFACALERSKARMPRAEAQLTR